MSKNKIEPITLQAWIKKKQIKTKHFMQQVGCSKPVISKAKKGLPICTKYAHKIIELTNGEVVPLIRNMGREA